MRVYALPEYAPFLQLLVSKVRMVPSKSPWGSQSFWILLKSPEAPLGAGGIG